MRKIKIERTDSGHRVFLDGEDISFGVQKISIDLDAKEFNGAIATVNIEFLAEVDIEVLAEVDISTILPDVEE